MLVLVTTNITKIHVKHLCKDGMAFYKTHVELRIIACTHKHGKNDKRPFAETDLTNSSHTPLPIAFQASR